MPSLIATYEVDDVAHWAFLAQTRGSLRIGREQHPHIC